MSEAGQVGRGGGAAIRLPWVRWAALGLMLLAEYLLISVAFDAETVVAPSGFSWLRSLGILAPLAVAVATATFMLHGQRVGEDLRSVMATTDRLGWPYLVGHVLAYGSLLLLTSRVFGTAATSGHPASAGLVIAWLASGIATLALWVLAALNPRTLGLLGRRLRRPMLVGLGVGAAAWVAGLLTMKFLWYPLARTTLWLVVPLVGQFTGHAVVDAEQSIVGSGSFVVRISPECSGYEGIGLVCAFLGTYIFLMRGQLRIARAIGLLPVAILTIYLANVLRIASLVAVGARWSPEVAIGGLHSKAGWVLVCAISLGFVMLLQRSAWLSKHPRDETEAQVDNPVTPYLLPLLSLIAASLVTGMFVARFNAYYFVGPAAATVTLFIYRRKLPRLWAGVSWEALAAGALVFAMWLALERLLSPAAATGSSLQESVWNLGAPWATLWLAARVVGSVVVVPIVEELAFRGYLMRRLVDRDFSLVSFDRFTWLSFLVSSVAFGLLHQRWFAGTLAGMAFAAVQYRRGRLGDAIIAHAVANGLIAVAVLAGDQWSLWG